MTFGYPLVLAFLLVTLPLAMWAVARQQRRRKAALDVFGETSLLARGSAIAPDRIRSVRQGVRLGALALGVLALARPQFGNRPASLAQTGRDVLVLLDLSRSMNAADVANGKETRLEAAKRAAVEVLAASPGDRVGLIVFGGSAFLQLPLTGDRAAFRRFLEAASTDDIADPSTDLSRALITAATAFEHDGERGFQSVLLLSDGESRDADLAPVVGRLRGAGIPVFAIGFGSTEGAPVPADSSEAPERWHRDHIGRVVQSHLEERDLLRAGRETNGGYARWTPDAGPAVGAELARLEKRTLSSRASPERADRFQWPLGLAVVLLAIEPLLGVGSRRRLR
jgi:Ca-activated chloride channel family protein